MKPPAERFRSPEGLGLLTNSRIQRDSSALFSLIIRKDPTKCCFEHYRLTTTSGGCLIEAGDTEGVRRALVALEDEILSNGAPILALGVVERSPVIQRRLSRCFYGPIKRPPMNRDELEDDIDYYPDEYLNRLAHEGVNGLWLTISFRDTIPSDILPGFGRRSHIHIPKLCRTVAKCAKYGIKVFAFFIEPTAFIDERDNPRYLDIRLYEKDYPELMGNRVGELTAFCTDSDLAKSFLRGITHTLFTLVPGLGGMIDISVGERFTHCCSGRSEGNSCLRCASRTPSDVLADVLTRRVFGQECTTLIPRPSSYPGLTPSTSCGDRSRRLGPLCGPGCECLGVFPEGV